MNDSTSQPCNMVRPLPRGGIVDGRPVWEPPIFNYSAWIGDEYEKQREAVLKFYNGDVVKTTKFFNFDVEADLLDDYRQWILFELLYRLNRFLETDAKVFWQNLAREVEIDRHEVQRELKALDTTLIRKADGIYYVQTRVASDAPFLIDFNSDSPLQLSPENEDSTVTPQISSLHAENEEAHSSHASESTESTHGMERPAVEDANETSPLLPTSSETDEDDTNPWNAAVCGCPCS